MGVFISCSDVETPKVDVIEKVSPEAVAEAPIAGIVENSVAWDEMAKKNYVEVKKAQVFANYLEEHKGEKAKREAISSIDIYNSMKKHCAEYDIGIEILVGLSIEESNVAVRPRDSRAGCRGICQISPFVLSDFNTKVMWPKYRDGNKFYTWEDMYDYDKNIEVACYYIRWLWDTFDDIKTIEDVLISYNAGHSKLAKYKAINDVTKYHYHTDIIAHAKECNFRLNLAI